MSKLKYILIMTLFMLFALPSVSLAGYDFTIPEGYYSFIDTDTLSNGDFKEHPELFKDILNDRQSNIIDEVVKLSEDDFKKVKVDGDLEIEGGGSLWNYSYDDLQDLKENKSPTKFTMQRGGKEYKIYIPQGMKKNDDDEWVKVNTAVINNAIAAIEDYQSMVREAIFVGGMKTSYNIYTMVPSEQTPLEDILETDAKTGLKVIKSTASGMEYSLVAFTNPIFGRIEAIDLLKDGKIDKEKLYNQLGSMKLSVSSDGKSLEFEPSSKHLSFLENLKSKDNIYTEVKTDSIALDSTNGIKEYKPEFAKDKTSVPKSVVESVMPLMIPSVFTLEADRGYFKLFPETGYKLQPNFKFHIAQFLVFGDKADGSLERLGDFVNYGLNVKDLVVASTTIGKDGKYDPKGVKIGVLVPLRYNETIVTLGGNGESVGISSLKTTGRTLRFNNDYSGKITLDTANYDLLSACGKGDCDRPVPLRRFAFAEGKTYKDVLNHGNLDTMPSSFQVHIVFVSTKEDEGLRGLYMVRNNFYNSSDDTLIKWLESPEAEALTNVDAKELHNYITGYFEVESKELNFEEWQRLDEIRNELDVAPSERLKAVINVVCLVFGVFLITYSVLLMIAYWLDMFNVLIDFSFVYYMTFKRVYPVHSSEDLAYISRPDGELKYMSFWGILITMFVGIGLGMLFMFVAPIIDFAVWVYFKITSWVGVV